jgi:hypothetical protein
VTAPQFRQTKSVDATIRNPLFLFRLFGLFLLRKAHRAFLDSLLNAPPRNKGRFKSFPAISTMGSDTAHKVVISHRLFSSSRPEVFLFPKSFQTHADTAHL